MLYKTHVNLEYNFIAIQVCMIFSGDSELGFPVVVTVVKSSRESGAEILSRDGHGH